MLDIKISDAGTTLGYTDHAGNKSVKGIDLSDLIKVLSANVGFDMGFLPIGTRYLGTRGEQTHIVIERPASTYKIKFDARNSLPAYEIEDVKLPPALIFFCLSKANDAYFVSDSRIFAMAQNHIMLGIDGLYKYPTPNIYSDARICWGQNDDGNKNFKSLAALNGIVQRFFTAPFNDDLFGTTMVQTSFPWAGSTGGAMGYFKQLVNQPFDNKWLVPATNEFKNFETAVKTIFKTGV
jgi:hypothetical protein